MFLARRPTPEHIDRLFEVFIDPQTDEVIYRIRAMTHATRNNGVRA